MRSKLLEISIKNLGCIGNDGLTVALDNILCLVGNNNTGKSTVLRAYELAVGTESYSILRDKPKFTEGETEIELSVHIPIGVGNIAEKWKLVQGDLHIVKADGLGMKVENQLEKLMTLNLAIMLLKEMQLD